MVLVPQEIAEHIIDKFAENQSFHELLHLRSVSRSWRPRVDFHTFGKFKLKLHKGPSFISFLKASNYNIGQYIEHLTIWVEKQTSTESVIIPPEYRGRKDYSSIRIYLRNFVTFLPNVKILSLLRLTPLQIEYVPCFPHVKHLVFRFARLTHSQFFAIIRAARLLESIEQDTSSLEWECQEVQMSRKILDNDKAMLRRRVKTLRSYTTSFTYWDKDPSRVFELFLFPKAEAITTLSLSTLVCRTITQDQLPIVAELLHASSRSLRYLFLRFWSSSPTDELRKTFDLSRCVNLKYIRFEGIRKWPDRDDLAASLIVLGSLHKLTPRDSITVCLVWRDDFQWGEGHAERMDQILSSLTNVVREVEVAVPQPQKYYDTIIKDLSRTFATCILSVKSCTDLALIPRA